ncbi:DUF1156 domain-containing protein [Tolypothrix campylonemoides VB511288]|nr:DUF1156 domain-containing protein [Tolypothrix campylonemoides VB511288]
MNSERERSILLTYLISNNNLTSQDRRLIEDFIPIREIFLEAAREKSITKGHISTLPLWWRDDLW